MYEMCPCWDGNTGSNKCPELNGKGSGYAQLSTVAITPSTYVYQMGTWAITPATTTTTATATTTPFVDRVSPAFVNFPMDKVRLNKADFFLFENAC